MAAPNASFILLMGLVACLLQPQSLQAQTQGPATTPRSPPEVSSAALATTAEDEPITSTLDSVGVDPVASTIVNSAEDSEDSDIDSGVGIEPKSIAGNGDSANENSLASSNAKLTSIDAASGEESTPDTSDFASGPPAVGPRVLKSNLPSQLNMSQVDDHYVTSTRDEAQTVESWRKMSKKLKKGIGSVIGALVPYALNMSAEAKISSNCSGAMLKWILSMNQLKAWALRMLDAAGKPIAGLLEGSMTMFGNYRECLKVRAPDDDEIEFAGEFKEYFRGKYCIIQAKPYLPEKSRFYNLNSKLKTLMQPPEDEDPPQWYDRTIFDELSEWLLAFNFVNIRYDLCVPSQCSREDIQKAVNYMIQGIDLKARVVRCETEASNASLFFAAKVESGSEEISEALVGAASASSDPNYTPSFGESFSQLGWLLVPLLATMVVFLATALSMSLGDKGDDDESSFMDEKTKFKKTIKSLSLHRSLGSHLNIDYDQLADDKPLALYGIKFLLVLWVILVESAVNLKFEFLRELMMLKDLIFWWPMQFIINSSLQFDSIILLTAFTMGYKNSLNDGVNQAKALYKYVMDKYIRLMPSILVMVALAVLLPLVYRGPVWNDYVTRQSASCQSTGWLNLIFLQNYLPYNEICLPQTWLFCVELQLVLIMAPIVYYLNEKYTKNYYNKTASGSNQREKDPRGQQQPDASKSFYWLQTAPGLILLACIFLGLGGSFYNVYANELPPSWFYTMADPDSKAIYFGQHLTKLWTHLAVFAAGILAGIECRRSSKNVMRKTRSNLGLLGIHNHHKNYSLSSTSLPEATANHSIGDLSISVHNNGTSSSRSSSTEQIDLESGTTGSNLNPAGGRGHLGHDEGQGGHSGGGLGSVFINFVSCLVAIATMATIIFSTHEWSLNDLPAPLIAGLFDAGSRFIWSVCFIWILYMVCVPDEQRQFNWLARLLGHPLMISLGKLSFLIYLIHPFVHMTVLAIQEQPIYSSWLMLFHILIGNITITVILSALMSLFIEMPCRNLFRRCETSIFLARHQLHSSSPPSILTPTSSASSASTTT